MTTSAQPTFQDIDVTLRLYELRREAVMRESRNLINSKFWPKSIEEVLAVANDMTHPMNAAWRQVTSFWEMAYSFGRNGIVHPEFLVENNGEGLFVYSKIAPFVEDFRKQGSATAFQSAEWAATKTNVGRARFPMMLDRAKKIAAQKG